MRVQCVSLVLKMTFLPRERGHTKGAHGAPAHALHVPLTLGKVAGPPGTLGGPLFPYCTFLALYHSTGATTDPSLTWVCAKK